ncbi:hypothetical protein AAMO2058_000570500 [Amorphochlora amoebiformis]
MVFRTSPFWRVFGMFILMCKSTEGFAKSQPNNLHWKINNLRSKKAEGRVISRGFVDVHARGKLEDVIPTENRRRQQLIAIGELVADGLLAVGCEIYGRPEPVPDDVGDALRSLLPRKTDSARKVRAQELLIVANQTYQKGYFRESVNAYTEVLALAPTNWKIAQSAIAGRDLARKAIIGEGFDDPLSDNVNDAVKQWIWGRGVRWPFHYIIAGILARPLVVTSRAPSRVIPEM